MTTFVKFKTKEDSEDILINVDKIVVVYPDGKHHTKIYLDNGQNHHANVVASFKFVEGIMKRL